MAPLSDIMDLSYKRADSYFNDAIDLRDWGRACFGPADDAGFGEDKDVRSRRRELSEELLRPCRL